MFTESRQKPKASPSNAFLINVKSAEQPHKRVAVEKLLCVEVMHVSEMLGYDRLSKKSKVDVGTIHSTKPKTSTREEVQGVILFPFAETDFHVVHKV